LLTGDLVQAKTAEAEGVKVIYFRKEKVLSFTLENFFDKETMSVHLKEGCVPKAKKGMPGNFKLVSLSDNIITKEMLSDIAHEIVELNRVSDESFTEISKRNVSVIQLKEYRIAITRPPFSEKMEITAVRPIMKVSLDDYRLSSMLRERIDKEAEGIIIAGPPGHGKSTLSQALAEHYLAQGMIVKTMENPRDLQLGPEITQYSPLESDMAKTADILLLVRPDITIYDEIRKRKDFIIFADLRLAGVGMVGVVHATKAIDVMHRFIGKVELGMIPHVVDTIIFVKGGKINSVLNLDMKIKVPHGMYEQDLARPIIEISDFETGNILYEIYTYGEQTVIMPVKSAESISKIQALAEETICSVLKKYTHNPVINIISSKDVIVRVPKEDMSKLIGRKGTNISNLEKKLGLHISVEPIVDTLKESVSFNISELGGYISIILPKKFIGTCADVYKGDEFLLSATVGRKAQIKVKKRSDIGKKLMQATVLKELRILVE
ncbi:MAG: ATPase, T2SS/T4P/T4SS family, partial [archaeon]|nr:ATPase, T2SS/T4P/T4SS family [archaeon]